MSTFYQERIQAGELVDLFNFSTLIMEYYESKDMEYIRLELKKDFKNIDKIIDIMNFTKYEFDDLVINITKLYDKFFSASNIRTLRTMKDELSKHNP